MRLIDADKLFQKALDIIKDNLCNKELGILNMIAIAETIDAEPVKHGKWLDTRRILCSVRCSVCGGCFSNETLYCPNCGAKMDGGNKND